VSSFNTRAQTFYARQGYRQVGQFDNYVIDGASELLLYNRVR
jgi:ribosomal protein S18 acetylase RimI-like enzyme